MSGAGPGAADAEAGPGAGAGLGAGGGEGGAGAGAGRGRDVPVSLVCRYSRALFLYDLRLPIPHDQTAIIKAIFKQVSRPSRLQRIYARV